MTTRAEVAAHLDVSLKTLSRLINDGVIAAKPGAGVDIDLARINYINHLRKGRTTKGVGGDYSEERTRLTRAQADKAEAEVDHIKGITVEIGEVLKVWTTLIANCRARLITLPTALTPSIQAARDEHEITELLTDGINDALDELDHDGLPDASREALRVSQQDVEPAAKLQTG